MSTPSYRSLKKESSSIVIGVPSNVSLDALPHTIARGVGSVAARVPMNAVSKSVATGA